MTGLTFMSVEFNRKRLELLREIVPDLRRVAILANPEHPGEDRERAFTLQVGQDLGMDVTLFETRKVDDLDAAFAAIARDPPQAISLFSDGFAVQNRQRIIDAATRLRVPVVAGWAVFAESGALFSYGPLLMDSYRRLAYYVDRILKGATPSELPIEQPATFELVLNQKTAAMLSLRVPTSVLIRADRVIS
jgi:putative ABC transport system substrate-binding protein